MSRLLIHALVIVLILFGAVRITFDRPQASTGLADDPLEPQGGSTTVEVTFDGLMVFEKVDRHYEVGIVVAPGHRFVTTIGKHRAARRRLRGRSAIRTVPQKLLISSDPWTLEVLDSDDHAIPENIHSKDERPCHRWLDTSPNEVSDHAYDFCWIMDLERDFNGGRRLTLNPGMLKPIIHLNQGELSTKFKYDELRRQQHANGSWVPYGFVTQTVALQVKLRAGEHLVLRNSDGGEIFRLPTRDGDVSAALANSPNHRYPGAHRGPSHFLLYWNLFSGLSDTQKVDISLAPGGFRPLNRWAHPGSRYAFFDDEIRGRTFDDQACGGTFLGVSTDGLK